MPTRPLITRHKDDLKIFPDMWHKVAIVLGLIFALYYPFYVGPEWLTIGNQALVAIVGAVALMIVTGFAGQISLGHAGFLAIGAYTAAILGQRYQIPFWLCMPIGGFVAAGVGVAIGAFALRLKGLYLAIVTIGLLYFVRHMLMAFPEVTGGHRGHKVPMYTFFEGEESMRDVYEMMDYGPITLNFDQKIYFIFLIIAVVVAWMAKNLHRSNAGRAMMAVRDHDIAASALGVNPAKAKIIAFALSSFFAGVAGAMLAVQQKYITPTAFNLDMSIVYIAMVVLGGVGTVFGAVAGAIAFVVLIPVMEVVGPYIPFISQIEGSLQSTVMFSVLVCAFLIFEPLGLFGIWLRIKRYFMGWPFRY
jgi:branched-chain amino acid transport system permease protein